MTTVGDFIDTLSEYDRNIPLFQVFDDGGNYYFPRPALRDGIGKDGIAVLIIAPDGTEDHTEIRDIVSFPKDSSSCCGQDKCCKNQGMYKHRGM
jgi:hypothetical protein